VAKENDIADIATSDKENITASNEDDEEDDSEYERSFTNGNLDDKLDCI
jgi:hypothetical protein